LGNCYQEVLCWKPAFLQFNTESKGCY